MRVHVTTPCVHATKSDKRLIPLFIVSRLRYETPMQRSPIFLACLALGMILVGGCRKAPPAATVTLYTSVDEPFARMVIAQFERQSGLKVALITDSEAGKTTGLVQRIVAEAQTGRVRADVFWSSEVFNTILLARQGHLAAFDSPAAADIPARYRDPQERWSGTSVRARVLAFDPQRVPRADVPTTWEALGTMKYAKDVAIANPVFGTTRGHIGAMQTLWGPGHTKAFLLGLRDGGAQVVDGNSASVRAVIAGQVLFAATDSDDVFVAQKSGASLDMVFPDMGDGGTLLIPCTVALLAGAPSPENGRKLVDFLLSAEVEELLAKSDSGNIPVRAALREKLNMPWPAESKVTFEAAAEAMDAAVGQARDILLR